MVGLAHFSLDGMVFAGKIFFFFRKKFSIESFAKFVHFAANTLKNSKSFNELSFKLIFANRKYYSKQRIAEIKRKKYFHKLLMGLQSSSYPYLN